MKDASLTEIIEAISGVVSPGFVTRSHAHLHEPVFLGNEEKYLKACLQTTMVSSIGPFVERFEKMLADYTGVPYAVACSSGTAALHISLILSDVSAGDEILIPALSFVATANAVQYSQAIPHFVDIDPQSLGLDVKKLRIYLQENAEVKNGTCWNKKSGRRILAVIPMHAFGHPVDLDDLAQLCKDFSLVLIEDAAESLGSFYHGKHTGSHGLLSALSFNGNKIITTGGGGAILTHRADLAKKAKHLTTTAKVPHEWKMAHDEVGYNYRLPNLNAALGCAQMEQIGDFLSRKRKVARKYLDAFSAFSNVKIVGEPEGTASNYWLVNLLVGENATISRDQILRATHDKKIMTRPAWDLLSTLKMYQHCPRMNLSQAQSVYDRMVSLPSSTFLGASL
jgi:perosamine synthetase